MLQESGFETIECVNPTCEGSRFYFQIEYDLENKVRVSETYVLVCTECETRMELTKRNLKK